MNKQLFIQAITKYIAGVLLVGTLIFLPAGTLSFRNGWILMAILFVPMFLAGLVMMKKNPDLLRKRLDAREKESEQKEVVALSGLMFFGSFHPGGIELSIQMDDPSGYRCIYRCRNIPAVLSSLCRSLKREYLSFQDYRGTGRSEGHRYRIVWNRSSSDVYGNCVPLSFHASGTWFSDLFCGDVGIYPDHRQEDQE